MRTFKLNELARPSSLAVASVLIHSTCTVSGGVWIIVDEKGKKHAVLIIASTSNIK